MSEQIKVTVEMDGSVSFEVQNISGSRCVSVTRIFEKGLGDILERNKTKDFYKTARKTAKNHIRNRSAE